MSALPVPRSPAEFPHSPLSAVLRQPMLLGLFLPLQSGGWSASTAPRGTDWSFDYNSRLTLQAEALGFDLAFGLAQWVGKGGHGGAMQYREQSIDSFMATAALCGLTSRILLISTLHVLYGPWHPLHLAKFGATLDHISKGRWGINLVTGHLAYEAPMFGMERAEHDRRYAMADEFSRIAEGFWAAEGNLDYQGEFWRTTGAYVTPKPLYGRPILVNATGSPAGMAYAARHSDIVFTPSPGGTGIDEALPALPAHNARIQAAAAEAGRSVRILINPTVVCRDTEQEAWDYYRAIVAGADDGAVDGFIARGAVSDAQGWKKDRLREHRIVGGNLVLVGSPQQIVDQFLALQATGIGGVQLSFFDFEPDLAHFGQKVLPLMKQAGLRL
ncbi:LLM class flavin-dependent oxidoreductase [Xylophilus rhododendri]|uniref:LLM class flavin-dependent oxidoreductase n=1 Tax=Xylophilus rhododendri TaxID=2697032 RepID=A0A857JBB8_9BURK|nr:LLM class flavin-dependent oxidoreductase [Xylophilus rhododendri]QHJ01315.1 LLM class flavin-dependent oxidoreductase [Xylophilus rhododendri]